MTILKYLAAAVVAMLAVALIVVAHPQQQETDYFKRVAATGAK